MAHSSRGFEEFHRLLKTAIAEMPVIGPALAIQVFDRISARQQERASSFVRSLSRRVERLEAKSPGLVTTKYLETDEFLYFFVETILHVQREVRLRKLAAFRAVVINTVLEDPRIQFDRKDYFFKTLTFLQEEHLKLLSYIRGQVPPVLMSDIWVAFHAKEEAKKNYLFSGIDILANRLLIECVALPMVEAGAAGDKQKIDHAGQEFKVTALGREFLKFIELSQ